MEKRIEKRDPEIRRSKTSINKVGNSASVRLSREVLNTARMEIDQRIEIEASEGEVVIRPADDNREKTREAAHWVLSRYPLTMKKLGE